MRIPRSHLALALGCAALAAVAACSDAVAPSSSPSPSAGTVTDAAVALSGPVIVSNISVASGKTYVAMKGAMTTGAKVYTDRVYKTMSPLPSIVQGATYIQTANDDKVSKPKSTSFLSFTVDRAVTVYVAHDNRLAAPQWLSTSFTKTAATVVNTDFYVKQTLLVYKRSFPQGRVTLG